MFVLLVLLALVAVWRVARLITADFISEPIRAWAARRGEKVGYLFECPWCLSIWVAPLVITPVILWPDNRVVWIAVVSLAASGVAGMLAVIENRLDR